MNLIAERRWAEGRNERLPALAALVQRKVEVIVANEECPCGGSQGMEPTR